MVAAEPCLHSMENLPFSSSFAPTHWGWTRDWEVTQPGQQAWSDQRDIPYKIELSSKNWSRGSQGSGFSLSYWLLHRGWLGTGWLVGDDEWFTLLYFWALFFSLLVMKLFLSKAKSFCLLFFLFLPPSHWVMGVGECLHECLAAGYISPQQITKMKW